MSSRLPYFSRFNTNKKKKKTNHLLGAVYDLCRVGRGGEWSRKVLLGAALREGAGPSLKITSGLPWPLVR